jgi:flavin-dependent dehydrogenase
MARTRMAHRHRIAICGAGQAGTSMALELVRLGVDPAEPVLFGKARFPRPKLCGGAVTWRGTERLARWIDRPA